MIVSPPENAKDRVGKNVAIVCEAQGYPIPTIEWVWTRVDGKTEVMPNDDMKVSVNMRGGPEKWQITGWLQVYYTRILPRASGVGSSTNHPGSKKKNGPYTEPVLLRQGEPGTSQYNYIDR